ncbi:hypothetical protein GLAREA_11138 [Glarea lozoyensis ATCC 20868]|uniref:Uncharacterized protein n=1 Tax=Glarea lozoyensis (strain ATCC 20868 / MF5171) TaxID=1116229 RepID=S3DEA5_GLAL2|nr:uncharacterized protein GLAREA_11138 [Glarea lozoyensis ATCC 20868]EPE35439.1 hypothetical protein GLAREA_11138 [Glarea lozoyensis ATCC 20868]
MHLGSIFISLGSLVRFTIGLPYLETRDLPCPLVPFQYDGPLGGHNVSLTGTVGEMLQQMKEIHPEFDISEHPTLSERDDDVELEDIEPDDIEPVAFGMKGKATEPEVKKTHCCGGVGMGGYDWKNADWYTATNAMFVLDHFVPICKQQPKTCSKIACYDQASIVLCNDRDVAVESHCNALRQPLWDLRADCTFRPNNDRGHGRSICGQIFLDDALEGLNLIVKSEKRGSCEGQVPWNKIDGKINRYGKW